MPAEVHGRRSERRVVAALLRAGLAVSAGSMTVGLSWAVAAGRLAALPLRLGELDGSRAGALLMGIGLIVLALTPAARVVALVIDFSIERDWRFAAVAAGVAALLSIGIALGHP